MTSLSLISITASAAIISNSGEEVAYTYETEFRALARSDSENKIDPRALADFHALHLYGLFQSAEYVSRYGLPPDLYEGFAGTMFPEIVSAKITKKNNDPYLWVRYKARQNAGDKDDLAKLARKSTLRPRLPSASRRSITYLPRRSV